MAAPTDRVWAWLIRASLWPTWYGNSARVQFLNAAGPDLTERTRFRWKTFGVTLVSTVLEYVPEERIAWDARTFGLDAYHAWVLQPHDDGCLVRTEETQHGVLARLGKLFLPDRMHTVHQIWLEALAGRSRTDMPPPLPSAIP